MTITFYEPGVREVRVDSIPLDSIQKAIAAVQLDLDSRWAKRLGKWFRRILRRGVK